MLSQTINWVKRTLKWLFVPSLTECSECSPKITNIISIVDLDKFEATLNVAMSEANGFFYTPQLPYDVPMHHSSGNKATIRNLHRGENRYILIPKCKCGNPKFSNQYIHSIIIK